MKKNKFLFSAIMLSFSSNILLASFSDSLNELEKIVNSINAVFNSLKSGIEMINSIFGIEAVLLLVAVIIFSSGLSAVGVPKGRLAFFSALGCADFFWLVWLFAAKPESYVFLIKVIKTNLILLSPYLMIISIKILYPILLQHIRRKIYAKRGIRKQQLLEFSNEVMFLHASLIKHIQADVIEENDYIVLSKNSNESLNKLLKKLMQIKKYRKSLDYEAKADID